MIIWVVITSTYKKLSLKFKTAIFEAIKRGKGGELVWESIYLCSFHHRLPLVLVLAPTNANKMHGGEWEQSEGRSVQNYGLWEFFQKILTVGVLSKLLAVGVFSQNNYWLWEFFLKNIDSGSFVKNF